MQKAEMGRLDSIDRWLGCQVTRAVDAVWLRWARQGSERSEYLWFKRGGLSISPEAPDGYQLGESERVPSHLEWSALYNWVMVRARRLGCLPEGV